MPGITAVLITKNAERRLRECLSSLKEVVDEIIVFDSGSTDNTLRICKEYGAFIHTGEWKGYGPTRNLLHSHATFPYILAIDADEVLSPKLADEIKKKKAGLSAAYFFPRLNHYCGLALRHGGCYPDFKLRLYPKDTCLWNDRPVHEELIVSLGLPLEKLTGDLLHYTFDSVEEQREKSIRYARLASGLYVHKSIFGLLFLSILSPAIRFMKNYFFRGGILDGYYGLIFHLLQAREVHLKYWFAYLSKK